MKLQDTVNAFKAHQKKMHAYNHAMGLLNYDAATAMPPGASSTLGDTLAVLSGEIYRLTVNDDYRDMLLQEGSGNGGTGSAERRQPLLGNCETQQ